MLKTAFLRDFGNKLNIYHKNIQENRNTKPKLVCIEVLSDSSFGNTLLQYIKSSYQQLKHRMKLEQRKKTAHNLESSKNVQLYQSDENSDLLCPSFNYV